MKEGKADMPQSRSTYQGLAVDAEKDVTGHDGRAGRHVPHHGHVDALQLPGRHLVAEAVRRHRQAHGPRLVVRDLVHQGRLAVVPAAPLRAVSWHALALALHGHSRLARHLHLFGLGLQSLHLRQARRLLLLLLRHHCRRSLLLPLLLQKGLSPLLFDALLLLLALLLLHLLLAQQRFHVLRVDQGRVRALGGELRGAHGLDQGNVWRKGLVGVPKEGAQDVEAHPVTQLDGQVRREVARFVPLPHAFRVERALQIPLRVAVEPLLRHLQRGR